MFKVTNKDTRMTPMALMNKRIYIGVGHKSAINQNSHDTIIYKSLGGYSNLNSSTLNQILCISIKQIC